jgi:hypothetical protein
MDMPKLLLVCGIVSGVLVGSSAAARACGMTPHVGPTGLVLDCDGAGQVETPWRVAVQGGGVRSELTASGQELGIEQASLTVRAERRLGTRYSVGAAVGSILGGALTSTGGETVDLGVGWTAGVSGSMLAVVETGLRPFVLASLSLAYSVTHGDPAGPVGRSRYTGRDVRLGVAVGKSLGPVRAYAAGRVFGGGFTWEGTSPPLAGADSHLYQVGAGAALDLPLRLDLLVEAMPLGERSLTAGVGRSF